MFDDYQLHHDAHQISTTWLTSPLAFEKMKTTNLAAPEHDSAGRKQFLALAKQTAHFEQLTYHPNAHGDYMSTVIICGAGVDKSEGLDMPLATELVPKIRDFLKTPEGQEIDEALRAVIPNLRFSYDKFIREAIDKLSNDFRSQVDTIVTKIKAVIQSEETDEADKKVGRLIVLLFEKIQKLQEDVRIDEETEELITEVFGGNIDVEDDNIIHLPKLTFTDVFNTVMRKLFEKSLDEPQHPILKYVRGNLMDFEQLLMESFIGFYTGKHSDIKKYMYLSWTLWAYMKHSESIALEKKHIPFYSNIPKEWSIITLNYTSFAHKAFTNDKPIYFHGNLQSFIRMHDRQLNNIDSYESIRPIDFIKSIVTENTHFEKNSNPRTVVPSLVPPLTIKPVLSNVFIETWHKTKETIKSAENIIIVGYSFNYVDEHFNDLIRNNKNKNICIVGPRVEGTIDNIRNIFSYSDSDYVHSRIQDRKSFSKDGLTLIKAAACDLDWKELDLKR